jgi:uncharacterized protein (TIGR03083 family)
VSLTRPTPILCAHLLREVDEALITLLESLEPHEWSLPTVAGTWTVRDVAAHLLDTPLRKLSLLRDQWLVEPVAIDSPADLAALVNRLNAQGVAVYRRLSPAVLIALLRVACEASASFHESLDPFTPATFAVSWAGEDVSLNWFDTARELTERWHHQQQIRLAANRPGLMTPVHYGPVLDCFMRGMPHTYRGLDAPSGARLVVAISGDCGGVWTLERDADGWTLWVGADTAPAAHILVPQEIAWRVFTRGYDPEDALGRCTITGDRRLALPVVHLTAIVA